MQANKIEAYNNKIPSAEEQSILTPDKVIEFLKQGNKVFADKNLTMENGRTHVRNAGGGQHPVAIILSCMDARIPVADVFQCGIGDIFVTRVAGNIVNSDILGSMEYACKVSGSKLVVVMGHEHCSAIKSAIDGVEFGNITGLLNKIKPAIDRSRADFKEETTSNNPAFVEAVCQTNMELMVKEVRRNSPILKEMEDRGEIKIVGAIYNIESRRVAFY